MESHVEEKKKTIYTHEHKKHIEKKEETVLCKYIFQQKAQIPLRIFRFNFVSGLSVGRLQMSKNYECDVVYGKYTTDLIKRLKVLTKKRKKESKARLCGTVYT